VPAILRLPWRCRERQQTNLVNLLEESLVLATPVALGALTGLWSERSGSSHRHRGMMLAAAGVGFMTTPSSRGSSAGWIVVLDPHRHPHRGVLAMLLAVLSIRYNVNQIVGGGGDQHLALGLTGFLRSR